MTRKYLKERQQRNRELGKADMLNRCGFCKRALPNLGAFERWSVVSQVTEKFCDENCALDQADRVRLLEAKR